MVKNAVGSTGVQLSFRVGDVASTFPTAQPARILGRVLISIIWVTLNVHFFPLRSEFELTRFYDRWCVATFMKESAVFLRYRLLSTRHNSPVKLWKALLS